MNDVGVGVEGISWSTPARARGRTESARTASALLVTERESQAKKKRVRQLIHQRERISRLMMCSEAQYCEESGCRLECILVQASCGE